MDLENPYLRACNGESNHSLSSVTFGAPSVVWDRLYYLSRGMHSPTTLTGKKFRDRHPQEKRPYMYILRPLFNSTSGSHLLRTIEYCLCLGYQATHLVNKQTFSPSSSKASKSFSTKKMMHRSNFQGVYFALSLRIRMIMRGKALVYRKKEKHGRFILSRTQCCLYSWPGCQSTLFPHWFPEHQLSA